MIQQAICRATHYALPVLPRVIPGVFGSGKIGGALLGLTGLSATAATIYTCTKVTSLLYRPVADIAGRADRYAKTHIGDKPGTLGEAYQSVSTLVSSIVSGSVPGAISGTTYSKANNITHVLDVPKVVEENSQSDRLELDDQGKAVTQRREFKCKNSVHVNRLAYQTVALHALIGFATVVIFNNLSGRVSQV